ncbi:rho GTPase-activating protein 11A-like isoform X2 [Denticeps clupeoides]|uniref:rho GTPase-activating protein 11A-like isoform X2 n=1 Tax=Denticeps clupeoides TaxID=299321 RepID=UPI0010A5805B|nr:rho GTPase-activating protein 11A-like isoform X2 [Denticeps clupeoides]
MKISDGHVIRVVALQRLRVAHGIEVKRGHRLGGTEGGVGSKDGNVQIKVFGVPLKNVLVCHVPEYGLVPCFVADACQFLLKHAGTEGLFRRSSSVVRLKDLKAKLDQGEDCIPAALPCDVASLVKQFFRELPNPIIPTELYQALIQAQQLAADQEKISATQLLSCLLPERNSSTLRFFLGFLKKLSQRCEVHDDSAEAPDRNISLMGSFSFFAPRSTENKMNCHNLSVIFAPNFFPSESWPKEVEEGHDKMKISITRTLIENACSFGVVPEVVVRNIPALLDTCLLKEMDMDLKWKMKGLHCVEALPVTPCTWRTPSAVGVEDLRPNSKRTSRGRRTFCLGMLPRVLFGHKRTPGSAQQDSSPLVTPGCGHAGSSRRKSCASVHRTVRRPAAKERCSQSPTPLPSFDPQLQTPVGLTLKKTSDLKPESASSKTPTISSVLKNLCCPFSAGCNDATDSATSSNCSDSAEGAEERHALLEDHKNNNASPRSTAELREPLGPKCVDSRGEGAPGNPEKGALPSTPYRPSSMERDQVGLLKSGTPVEPKRRRQGRVAANVRIFSRLHLRPRVPKPVGSPLRFQRTPVYEYVKRINSYLASRRSTEK